MAERLATIGIDGAETYDYSSLSACESGEQGLGNDLVTDGDNCVWEIRGAWSTADTTALTIDGWTTSATCYIEIRAVGSARHAGKWTTTAHRAYSTGATLTVNVPYVTLDGLQVETYDSNFGYGIYIQNVFLSGTMSVTNCVLKLSYSGSVNTTGLTARFTSGGTREISIVNCVAYSPETLSTSCAGFSVSSGNTVNIRNCTAVNITTGFQFNSGYGGVTNCLAQDCTDGFYGAPAGSDYNCSDIASDAPGSNSVTGTVSFVDAANDDYHLASGDTVARGNGTDLSAYFTTDIDGDTRSAWDIGADEYSSGGGSALTASFADALSIGESLTRSASFAAGFSDAVALGDSMDDASQFSRSHADPVTLGEVLAQAGVFSRSHGDALTLGDSLIRAATFARAHSEALSMGDSFSAAMVLIRSFQDAISLGDSFGAALVLVRSFSDPLALGDSVTSVAQFSRSIQEALTLSDSVQRAAAYGRAWADAISLLDTTARAAVYDRAFADAMALGDLISTVLPDTIHLVNIWLSQRRETTFPSGRRETIWVADPS